MPMRFEELDAATRGCMLAEFEVEQSGSNPYHSKALSDEGRLAFPDLMRQAIRNGTEETLAGALMNDDYWNPTKTYVRDGVARVRQVNVRQAAERLAITEFNTWYVCGLAKLLLSEGVNQCQVYRAAMPKWEPAECSAHEGRIYPVGDIYRGHRASYWPEPGDASALSIPFGPGCHHTIRRLAGI